MLVCATLRRNIVIIAYSVHVHCTWDYLIAAPCHVLMLSIPACTRDCQWSVTSGTGVAMLHHVYTNVYMLRLPCSQKIQRFSIMPFNCQIKIRQIFYCMHVRMVIPYHAAKFKSRLIHPLEPNHQI